VSTVNVSSALTPSGDYLKHPHIRIKLAANTVINLNGPASSQDGKDVRLRLTIIQDPVGRSVKLNNVAATLPYMHRISRRPYAVTTLELVWNATANQSRKRWNVVNLTCADGVMYYGQYPTIDNFFFHPDLSSTSDQVLDNAAGWVALPASIKERLGACGVHMLVVDPGSDNHNAFDIPSWYWDNPAGGGVGGYYAGPGHLTNDRPLVVSLSGRWPMVHELGHAIDWNFHNGIDATRSLVGRTTTATVGNITAHPEWTALYNRLITTPGTPSSYAKTNAVEFFAEVIGRKIQDVAQHRQVLCITHLPQIAVFADSHFKVEKVISGDRTVSQVRRMTRKEQEDEIARMLGGIKVGKKTREAAAEMSKEARVA
jgi:hypothetical protein